MRDRPGLPLVERRQRARMLAMLTVVGVGLVAFVLRAL